ncbi:DUF6-domain-containing protein [Backusella circina FSU 941]|nr:DUF6-domain-containing protein [Backusella circina FSU 941]
MSAGQTSSNIPIPNESTSLLHNEQHTHTKRREMVGLLYMTLSALGFSTMSLFVKLSGANFPSFEIVLARGIIQSLLSLVCCWMLGVNPLGRPGTVRLWLFFRGLVGTLGLCLFFYSITKLPLADATVVFFLGPAFTAILASLVLGEPFSLFDGICSISCIIGVVLVSKPQFLFGGGGKQDEDINEWERLFAIFCALLGAVMSAIAYVTVRRIGKGAHFLVHVFYFGAVSTIVSPIGIALSQGFVMPKGVYQYSMLLLVGGCAFVGQCFLNQG